jgi:hypothetical protein
LKHFARLSFLPGSSGTGLPDFSWYMIPKPEKLYQNERKIYYINGHKISQMFVKYSKWPYNTYINIFQIQGLPKLTQIGIFCLKINRLATLVEIQEKHWLGSHWSIFIYVWTTDEPMDYEIGIFTIAW